MSALYWTLGVISWLCLVAIAVLFDKGKRYSDQDRRVRFLRQHYDLGEAEARALELRMQIEDRKRQIERDSSLNDLEKDIFMYVALVPILIMVLILLLLI